KTHSRREVPDRIGQGLPVVTDPGVDGEVAPHMNAILHETRIEPLLQRVPVDPEIDRLRVVLHRGQCQLTEGRRRVIQERERPENRRSWLAARTARRVMDQTCAEAYVVHSVRPR